MSSRKYKVSLYSGPLDGQYYFFDSVDKEFFYYDYTSMVVIDKPDFSNFEYHVYELSDKNDTSYLYNYVGVSPMEPQ